MPEALNEPLIISDNNGRMANSAKGGNLPENRSYPLFLNNEQLQILALGEQGGGFLKDLSNHWNPRYSKNVVISSRYTLFNFLPKSLLEQFRRLANVYFLVIGMIAVIGTYTSYYETAVEPVGILMPMIIVVLISVIKDGIEDIKRHRADYIVNSQLAPSINSDGKIEEIRWYDIKVGQTLIVYGDSELPADVVVLACGGIQGPVCYVETAAIDGETNLKLKNPCLYSIEDFHSGKAPSLSHDKASVLGLDMKRLIFLSSSYCYYYSMQNLCIFT